MQLDFLAIGELLADVISIDYCDNLQEARNFRVFQGGSPSNVAANLCWMGKAADVVACVGDDGVGRFLVAEIKKAGIKGNHIQWSQAHPTSLVLVTRSKGTPDFLAYRMADAQLKPVEEHLLASAAIIHTTAFALSKNPARQAIMSAFQQAGALGKMLSVDWNFAPSIWGEEDGKEVFHQLLQLHPFVKVSLDDMERFFGRHSAEEYKNLLQDYGAAFICLTCGKDGVWYKSRQGDWQYASAMPVAEVVDTTGAGDAFWAGFLSALLEGKKEAESVSFALSVAAKKVQQQGPLYRLPA